MSFAVRLRQIREEKELTQTELGKILNLSKQAISSYEKGGSTPTPETLERMSEVFKVSIDWLIKGNKITIPDDPRYFDLGEVTLEEEYARKGLSKEMIRHYLDAAALAVEEVRKMHNKPIK